MTKSVPSARRLRSRSTALLVIHGIGEQNPYETLDAFTRGIFSFLTTTPNGAPAARISPHKVAHEDWTQVGMRIEVPQGAGPTADKIDLFEYYWAPYTEDKISARDTIRWLIRTDLSPLRYFSSNLQALQAANPAMSRGLAVLLFLREIARIVFLYAPLLIALVWLLAWLPSAGALAHFWTRATAFLKQPPFPAAPGILLFDLLGLLMLAFVAKQFLRVLHRRRASVQQKARRAWFLLAPIAAALFFGIAWMVSVVSGVSQSEIWSFFAAPEIYMPVLGAFLVWLISRAMTDYVADVAIYVNADAKSKNFEARTEVLGGAVASLSALLRNREYDGVILAGHSLGSVIAYDALNELLTQAYADTESLADPPKQRITPTELGRLCGLLTFGCPLDKIYYFFREHVREDQAIRAQILSMLYGFRKIRSGRDYRPFEFKYTAQELPALVWLNAWSPLDPVSGRLIFYRLQEQDQKSLWYWVPGLAHLKYWGDPRFYKFWVDRLLLEAPPSVGAVSRQI